MAIQGVEDCMGGYDAGTDSYNTRRYGTAGLPGHDAIVAERAVGSQRGVVDVNQEGVPTVDSSTRRAQTVAMI
jgi:hypothetical protein